jgi:hypothetical protein
MAAGSNNNVTTKGNNEYLTVKINTTQYHWSVNRIYRKYLSFLILLFAPLFRLLFLSLLLFTSISLHFFPISFILSLCSCPPYDFSGGVTNSSYQLRAVLRSTNRPLYNSVKSPIFKLTHGNPSVESHRQYRGYKLSRFISWERKCINSGKSRGE